MRRGVYNALPIGRMRTAWKRLQIRRAHNPRQSRKPIGSDRVRDTTCMAMDRLDLLVVRQYRFEQDLRPDGADRQPRDSTLHLHILGGRVFRRVVRDPVLASDKDHRCGDFSSGVNSVVSTIRRGVTHES